MFTLNTKVRFHDTDAAGVVFFANYFRLAHDAYEAFMSSIGFEFGEIIAAGRYHILIVRAEADYRRALKAAEHVRVHVNVDTIGRSSFALAYEIVDSEDQVTATVRTVHVTMDPGTASKIDLPEKLRHKLAGG